MTQISFDPLTYQDRDGLDDNAAAKAALKARNVELKARKAAGEIAYGWRLTGQLRPYASFGNPDGRVRTVYYITVQS
jgi:hypothetical protein